MISVLDDPVFRVRRMDGSAEDVGLREVILNAHLYSDILGRTPTGRCARMRFCIALLEDMYRPEDLDAREELFEQGRFDEEALDQYIAECTREGPRFLLDDPEHPFMQMPYDPELDARAEKPIAALMMDVPSGNNHVHTDHRMETEHALDARDAFEALLETYLFCPAGLAGASGVNNTPPTYFLVCGRNLFETLVLNMVSAEELENIPFGAEEVPWRRGAIVRPREKVAEMTFLRALTWQPRRATLNFDEDGSVRSCYLQPGLDFRGDGRWRDPHVAYFQKKDGSWGSLKPEPGRQVWRNVGNLLVGRGKSLSQPVALANRSRVWEDAEASFVQVEAIGLQTNQAACIGWTQEILRLPEAFLKDVEMADAFRSCVDVSEMIVAQMRRVIQRELDESSDSRKKDHPYNQVADPACALFLQCMHDELFDRTMYRILNWEPKWRSAFAEAVRAAIRRVLDDVANQSGASVDMLKRQNRVSGLLMGYAKRQLEGW